MHVDIFIIIIIIIIIISVLKTAEEGKKGKYVYNSCWGWLWIFLSICVTVDGALGPKAVFFLLRGCVMGGGGAMVR